MTEIEYKSNLGIDLSSTQRVYLTNPASGDPIKDDKGVQWYLDIVSSKNREIRHAVKTIMARYRASARRNKGIWANSLTPTQEDEAQAEIHSLVVKGWHVGAEDGSPAYKSECSPQEVFKWLMTGENDLFYDQISPASDNLHSYIAEVGNESKKK